MKVEKWNERNPTFEQQRRFNRLLTLHSLTDTWINTVSQKDNAAYRLERATQITLNPNLWLFEKSRIDQLPLNLGELVGAQNIDEFLLELQEFIWIIQASTLETVLSASERTEDLINVLQQQSWNSGKKIAESIWGSSGDLSVPDATRAFLQSHIYSDHAFIPERISPLDASFIWKQSPLQNPSVKDSSAISLLCELHEHLIRGFCYALSRSARIGASRALFGETSHPRFTLLSTC